MLTSCGPLKYKKVDAKEVSTDPKERVKKNIEEGRGFRLMGGIDRQGGKFDFASSNPLWRASLDTIEFMPLASANYSGGIIVTDWYADEQNQNESIKISIRFLSNEIKKNNGNRYLSISLLAARYISIYVFFLFSYLWLNQMHLTQCQ